MPPVLRAGCMTYETVLEWPAVAVAVVLPDLLMVLLQAVAICNALEDFQCRDCGKSQSSGLNIELAHRLTPSCIMTGTSAPVD